MGFNMVCKNTGKNCSYNTWFEQRVAIILATVAYLEHAISSIEDKLKEIDKEDEVYPIENNPYSALRIQNLLPSLKEYLIEPIRKIRNKDSSNTDAIYNILIESCKRISINDGLVCFGIYGVYLLCSQSDCGGAYSIGNSYDIIQLLEKIEPFVDKTDKYTYEAIYTINDTFSNAIIDIFRDSVNSNQPILIT